MTCQPGVIFPFDLSSNISLVVNSFPSFIDPPEKLWLKPPQSAIASFHNVSFWWLIQLAWLHNSLHITFHSTDSACRHCTQRSLKESVKSQKEKLKRRVIALQHAVLTSLPDYRKDLNAAYNIFLLIIYQARWVWLEVGEWWCCTQMVSGGRK